MARKRVTFSFFLLQTRVLYKIRRNYFTGPYTMTNNKNRKHYPVRVCWKSSQKLVKIFLIFFLFTYNLDKFYLKISLMLIKICPNHPRIMYNFQWSSKISSKSFLWFPYNFHKYYLKIYSLFLKFNLHKFSLKFPQMCFTIALNFSP